MPQSLKSTCIPTLCVTNGTFYEFMNMNFQVEIFYCIGFERYIWCFYISRECIIWACRQALWVSRCFTPYFVIENIGDAIILIFAIFQWNSFNNIYRIICNFKLQFFIGYFKGFMLWKNSKKDVIDIQIMNENPYPYLIEN